MCSNIFCFVSLTFVSRTSGLLIVRFLQKRITNSPPAVPWVPFAPDFTHCISSFQNWYAMESQCQQLIQLAVSRWGQVSRLADLFSMSEGRCKELEDRTTRTVPTEFLIRLTYLLSKSYLWSSYLTNGVN